MFVIVPNYVSDAINAKIDAFLAEYPEATHAREEMYDAMLEAYNVHGVIADITRPTKHTPDVVESATSSDIFPASEVSASEAESTPSHQCK